MRNTNRVVLAAGVATAAVGVAVLNAAGVAQAEPRYHWCPGEQWSGWMGVNWDTRYCHDNHYLDNVPHDPEHWQNGGTYDRDWPPPPQPPYYRR